MLKKLTFSLLCVFLFGLLSAQTFSPNKEKFVKELDKYLSTFDPSTTHDFIKEFEPFLLGNQMPESHFTKMVDACNLMVTKRLKPFPEIYSYVFSVYSFDKNKQAEASYTAWHSTVDKMLDSRNLSKFKEFITVSAGLFSKRMIYSSTNYECYFRGGQYVFTYSDKDGPAIQFTNGTLSCLILNSDLQERRKKPYEDSAVIYATNGIYDPVLEKWEGKGGKVTWEKVGLPSNETWAELPNYKFSLKLKSYNCDSVTLHTPLFSKPLLGTFSERTMNFTREIDKQFPQFISYDKALLIKNIIPDADYIGGFSLKGASFTGTGTQAIPAEILFYRNQHVFIRLKGQEFVINDKGLYASGASVNVALGLKDSITHPGIDVRYTKATDRLDLIRGNSGVSQSPYSDSYHQLDMYVNQISWPRKENRLQFTWTDNLSQEQRYANFESKNYFDELLYNKLQGLSQVHPLVAIWNYAYKYDEYTLSEGKVATALGRTIEQAKPLMLDLANMGFIAYDLNSKMIQVLPKTENFTLAKSRKKDYDNINFEADFRPQAIQDHTPEEIKNDETLKRLQAKYDQENAYRSRLTQFGEIDLASLDFRLEGVDMVNLSDKQQTAVFPDSSKIIIQNNRNFYFNGWASAGKWTLNIKDGIYDYAANKINIPYAESASFRVNPLKEEDGKNPIPLQSSIVGVKGALLVDNPENRSGIKEKLFPGYPKLVSKELTKVFYNNIAIQRGAYDSTRFYFAIQPFEFDSLDNFNEVACRFNGELISAGIFPSFKQALKVMPDYSLGFSTMAPTEGYDFYGTGSKYSNKIVLSNNGLQGAGTITYLSATAVSKAFTFLPDSTTGVSQFKNTPRESGVQVPDVESDQAFMIYSPKRNVMSVRSMQDPINFFASEAKLRGEAYLRPTGMTGKGVFDFNTALVGSHNFKFKRWDIDADSSYFQLIDKDKSHEDAGIAFKTDNVSAHVSFKDRKGMFRSNEGESVVDFPVNEYICKMDVFTWYMDKEEIEMSKSKGGTDVSIEQDLDLAGTNFISTNKDQDSLRFGSGKARFVLKTKTIFCDAVNYVDVADARIYPDSMKLIIRKKAQMDPLHNSRIVANYITKYHQIVHAETQITARRAYTSVGDYPYYDIDSTLTLVKMDKVYLDTSYQTVAVGNIEQAKSFNLSPQFSYYGKITMKAANPKLLFDGATKINHSCEAFAQNWMSFKAEIDPKNIQIPVSDNITSLDGKALSAGIVWHFSDDQDSIKMYPTFLSELTDPNDVKVISASGWLQFNSASKEFEIASREKLLNRAETGNYISLHTKSCSMNGDGKINVGMDYGDLSVDAVGVVNYNQTTKETTMNITAGFKTLMDNGIFEKLAEKIALVPELKPTNLGFTTLESAIANWSSQKEADKFKSDYTLKGEVGKIPGASDYTIVLSNIQLKSIPNRLDERGLITSQPEADIVSLAGKPVLKTVPIQVAFFKPPVADVYRMGLNIDLPTDTYFFNYDVKKKNGIMKIYTTDSEMKQSLTEMKPEKKKIKNFEYDLTTNSSLVSMFKRLFE